MTGGANALTFCEKRGDTGERGRRGVEAADELEDPEAGDESIVRGAVSAGDPSRGVRASARAAGSALCPFSGAGVGPRDFDLRDGGRGRGLDLREDARRAVRVGMCERTGVTGDDTGIGEPLAFPRPLASDNRATGVLDGGVTGGNAVFCATRASDLEPLGEFPPTRAFFEGGLGETLGPAPSVGGVRGRFVPRAFGDDVMLGRLEDEARGTSIRSSWDLGRCGDAEGDGNTRGIGGGVCRGSVRPARCGGGVDVIIWAGKDGGRYDCSNEHQSNVWRVYGCNSLLQGPR